MTYPYLLLILAGLALIGWGLPASHRLKQPFGTLAAAAVLAGVIAALFGVLLFMVPDFFRS